MKKILLIGGAGYVGSRLSNHLSQNGNDVYVLDKFWFGDFLYPNISKIKQDLWKLTSNDLVGFDVIVFLAGLANDPMAMFRSDLNFIENAAAPAYIAYISKQAGVKRFVHASSCSVYGYTKNEILDEASKIHPNYPYGISKLQSECGVMALEDENFRPIILRKGTICGWSPKMRYDLVVNTMLKDAIVSKKIVVNNPDLWRPLIDIRDVVQGYEKAISADLDISGIYNLAGINLTIGELGKKIHNHLTLLGFDNELIINNIEDIRNYKVSTTKIEKELNYKPTYTITDSLNDILHNIDIEGYNFNNPIFYNIETFKKVTK
jgi:nucleoside-diphosphate-sugar epimerase